MHQFQILQQSFAGQEKKLSRKLEIKGKKITLDCAQAKQIAMYTWTVLGNRAKIYITKTFTCPSLCISGMISPAPVWIVKLKHWNETSIVAGAVKNKKHPKTSRSSNL
jgi:hypothetical protein